MHNTFFRYTLTWTTIESLFYNCMLLTHQCTLYHTISSTTFGTIGTFFSLTFLGVHLCDLGFDASLFIFYPTWTTQHTTRFLLRSSIPSIGAWCIYTICLAFFFPSASLPPLIICVAAELTKKVLRSLLLLYDAFAYCAVTELITLLLYITAIWTAYFADFSLLIAIPWLTVLYSTTNCLILARAVQQRFTTVHTHTSTPSLQRITLARASDTVIQYMRSITSSNFIVPYMAHSNISHAASVYLITSIIHHIHSLLPKAINSATRILITKNRDYEAPLTHILNRATALFVGISLITLCIMRYYYLSETTALIAGIVYIGMIASRYIAGVQETRLIIEEYTPYVAGIVGCMSMYIYAILMWYGYSLYIHLHICVIILCAQYAISIKRKSLRTA